MINRREERVEVGKGGDDARLLLAHCVQRGATTWEVIIYKSRYLAQLIEQC